jgi:hypothetical protein
MPMPEGMMKMFTGVMEIAWLLPLIGVADETVLGNKKEK